MPYNIKNETPKITSKMEDCVNRVMSKGVKSYKGRTAEESAIAICKSSITEGIARSQAMIKRKK
jgi:hypothetical protein